MGADILCFRDEEKEAEREQMAKPRLSGGFELLATEYSRNFHVVLPSKVCNKPRAHLPSGMPQCVHLCRTWAPSLYELPLFHNKTAEIETCPEPRNLGRYNKVNVICETRSLSETCVLCQG